MEPNDLRFFTDGSVTQYRMWSKHDRTKCAIYFNSFDNSVSKFNMLEASILEDSLLFFAFRTLAGLQTAAVALLYKDDTVMTLFKVSYVLTCHECSNSFFPLWKNKL